MVTQVYDPEVRDYLDESIRALENSASINIFQDLNGAGTFAWTVKDRLSRLGVAAPEGLITILGRIEEERVVTQDNKLALRRIRLALG